MYREKYVILLKTELELMLQTELIRFVVTDKRMDEFGTRHSSLFNIPLFSQW